MTSDDSKKNTQSQTGMAALVREQIVRLLRADGLSQEQQSKLMELVGEALLQRLTVAILSKMPPESLKELADMKGDPQDPKNASVFFEKVKNHIPDVEGLIADEMRAGLKAYQDFLDKEVTSA